MVTLQMLHEAADRLNRARRECGGLQPGDGEWRGSVQGVFNAEKAMHALVEQLVNERAALAAPPSAALFDDTACEGSSSAMDPRDAA